MDTKLVLVMENLLGQDVLSFFQSQHNYSEEMVATVVTQVRRGCRGLHWRVNCTALASLKWCSRLKLMLTGAVFYVK